MSNFNNIKIINNKIKICYKRQGIRYKNNNNNSKRVHQHKQKK